MENEEMTRDEQITSRSLDTVHWLHSPRLGKKA